MPAAIILVQTQHPGNLGAVARVMMNMGFADLRLVRPQIEATHPEALERALKAKTILQNAKLYTSLKEAIGNATLVVGTTSKIRSTPLNWISLPHMHDRLDITIHENVALVFGQEESGLGNAEIQLCDWVIKIPTSDTFDSLNLSHAVVLVLYEFKRLQLIQNGTFVKKKLATSEQMEFFYSHLEKALLSLNFLDKQNPQRIMRDLRNIFAKATVNEREVSILHGICQQILHKEHIQKITSK